MKGGAMKLALVLTAWLLSGCVLIDYDPVDAPASDGGGSGGSVAGTGGTVSDSGAGLGGAGGSGGELDASADAARDADVMTDANDGADAASDGAVSEDAGEDADVAACAALDCSSLSDICNQGVCSELDGACIAEPVMDDTTCGSGLSCQRGRCEATATCAAGAACTNLVCATPPCHFECVDADDCRATCSIGMECGVDCTQANGCNTTCNGTSCAIDCTDSDTCAAVCANGASCDIDCTGANNCNDVTCVNGSTCTLDCTGANNCAFSLCLGGDPPRFCPNDVVVCNGLCP